MGCAFKKSETLNIVNYGRHGAKAVQSALNIVNYGDSERVSKLTLASEGREIKIAVLYLIIDKLYYQACIEIYIFSFVVMVELMKSEH